MRKIASLFMLSFFIFQSVCAQALGGIIDNSGKSVEQGLVDPFAWNFGKARQGEVLKHDFSFKNETKDVLNIVSVNTSCGCTTAQPQKMSLRPGEAVLIKVSFNSGDYLGEVKQFVYVNTDNADLSIIRFTISAEIVK